MLLRLLAAGRDASREVALAAEEALEQLLAQSDAHRCMAVLVPVVVCPRGSNMRGRNALSAGLEDARPQLRASSHMRSAACNRAQALAVAVAR